MPSDLSVLEAVRGPETQALTGPGRGIPLIQISDLLMAVSTSLDLMRPKLALHQRRVALLCAGVGAGIDLSPRHKSKLVMAALVHDLGMAVGEAPNVDGLTLAEDDLHAVRGAALLSASGLLSGLAPIIRSHQHSWESSMGVRFDGEPVSFKSHLLYLCDHVEQMIDPNRPILNQVRSIKAAIEAGSGQQFAPDAVAAFLSAARREVFWLQIDSPEAESIIRSAIEGPLLTLSYDQLLDLATIFGVIVDSKSRFTEMHSCGVAEVAEALAEIAGLDPGTIQLMKLAGHLHDLGKLAVPSEILEKAGPLTEDEMDIVRGHTYFTNVILRRIPGLSEVAGWGANHHEKLNGEGYPFGLAAEALSIESRIVSVADRFVALTEDRPYRGSLGLAKAMEIMWRFVENQEIDGAVVRALADNLDAINERRRLAQAEEHGFLSQIRELRR